ncbi:MAG: aminopeptidase, partial [Lachnospiraceae bacterium]
RIMKEVISLLEQEGLSVTAVRTPAGGRHARKAGYTVTNVNLQYDYDHRNDEGLLADKQWYLRKETALRRVYEEKKEQLARYAGPLVQETFGERLPLPVNAKEAIRLDKRQQRLKVEFMGRAGELAEQYIPSDKTSFTIVAYPLPSIGEKFPEIFEETLRVNRLDNEVYRKVQQCMIDALDRAQAVRVTGRGENHTDITVQLWRLNDPEKETIFENCTADVNIPAGEVFTSPVLAGTNGTLHVSGVFLGSTEYKNLEIVFADGKTVGYSCENYASKEENERFIRENLLKNHDWLPLGEFAIGTNTVAYTMGKKYHITEVLPILIAEKTGPHFAIGDTCYSHSEDHKVYNPDGKEIVARENECSALRKTAPEKAYFQCHTDITIPYDELGEITALCADGTKIAIVKDGRFVLKGTELLNEALEN